MPTKIVLACLISLTAACGAMASGQAKPIGVADRAENTAAKRGMAFARSHCAACHAVGTGMSPKPEAPSFEAIVNTPGLTAATLQPRLRDSPHSPDLLNLTNPP